MIAWKKYVSDLFIVFVLLIVSALLFLPNLDRHFLWQDEAQTALISRSILSYGVPHCSDEKNSFSQEFGAECGTGGVYKWHPWLAFYIQAVFFQFFGESDFVARFPGALFGIGTVLLCYAMMRSMGRSKRAALIASLLLSFMVSFLLLSRQCRYYSMVAFFSIACIWAYFQFMQSKKHAGLIFTVCTIFLFHIQMIYGAILLATILIHAVVMKREVLKRLIAPLIGILCCIVPWLLYVSDISYQSRYNINPFSSFTINCFSRYMIQLGYYVVPLSLLFVLVLLMVWRKEKTRQLWQDTRVFASFLLIFLVLTPLTISIVAPYWFFRYLVPLLPVCAILVAELIDLGFRTHPIIGSTCLVLFLLNQPLTDYYYELTHSFRGPIEALVEHLRQNAQPADTVAITYGDMPIKWYTDLPVVGGLAGGSLRSASRARWVVFRRHYLCKKDLAVSEYFFKNIQREQYRRIVLDAPDTPFENRESLKNHYFRTVTDEDSIAIYERIPEEEMSKMKDQTKGDSSAHFFIEGRWLMEREFFIPLDHISDL